MFRVGLASVIVALGVGLATPAPAQNNALGGAIIGGGIGAAIGGAATGRAGGAVAGGVIGAATGAMLGAALEPRPRGFYWYDGHCYRRNGRGEYIPVPRDRCW